MMTGRFYGWIENWSDIERIGISKAVKEVDRLMLDQLLTELNGAVAISEEKPLPDEYNPIEEE